MSRCVYTLIGLAAQQAPSIKAAALSDTGLIALPKDVETIVNEFAAHIGQFDSAVSAIHFSETDAKRQIPLDERRQFERQKLSHLENRLERLQALWRELTQQ